MSADMSKSTEVAKDEAAGRYEIRLDGVAVGLADYVEQGEAVELPHTYVDPGHRGEGLAGTLIRYALDDIVASGRKVVPTCPYVEDYITRHPEYAPAVAH